MRCLSLLREEQVALPCHHHSGVSLALCALQCVEVCPSSSGFMFHTLQVCHLLVAALRKEGFFLKLGNIRVIVRRLKPVNTRCINFIARDFRRQRRERGFSCLMSSFGVPPDPARIVSYFPGMSARNFSPIGANVCYRESIMKENSTRSDAFESVQRSEAQVATVLPTFAKSFTNYAILSYYYRCLKNWGQKSQPALI